MLTTITGKAVLTTKSQIASNSLSAGGKEIAKMVTNRTVAQAAKSAAVSNAIALPVAIVIDGVFLTYECLKMKKQLDEKKMSQEMFDKEVTKKTFGSVGGIYVGFGCAAIFPGIGTAAGFGIGLAGGLIGSFAGRFGGNLAGRGVYAAIEKENSKKEQMKRHS